MSNKGRIVVIDDEVNAATALETLLREDGYEVARAHDARSGLALLEKTDAGRRAHRPPHARHGRHRAARQDQGDPARDDGHPHDRLRHGEDRGAGHEARRRGLPRQAHRRGRAGGRPRRRPSRRSASWRRPASCASASTHKYSFDNLVGESPEMLAAFKTVRQVAPSSSSVLLLGESGTGQGAVRPGPPPEQPAARQALRASVACAALPETLLESELFGHEKGSFTGALYTPRRPLRGGRRGHALPRRDRRHLAHRPGQAAALPGGARVRARGRQPDVQGGRAHRGRHPSRPAARRSRTARFREDLYYRLNVIEIHIPPLRERGGRHPPPGPPLPARVRARPTARRSSGLSDDVLAMLLRHPWPGNVRELRERDGARGGAGRRSPSSTPAHFPTLRRAPRRARAAGGRGPAGRAHPRQHAGRARARSHPAHARGGGRQHLARRRRCSQISPRKIQYKLKEYQQAGAVIPRDHAAAHSSPARD